MKAFREFKEGNSRQFPRDIAVPGTKMRIVNRSTFIPIVAALVTAVSLVWAKPLHASDDPVVIVKTSLGEIDIQLDAKHAPISTANFLKYVDEKFYDGTVFHRVVRGFVAQGGGMTPDGTQKQTNAPIKNEGANGLHNSRGTISMARTNDPDSATSQFFLNFSDNVDGGKTKDGSPAVNLDPNMGNPAGYAVFGKIVKGLDVLDKMEALAGDGDGPPTQQITLISARRK
jgi:peptidyl-prolyl cis-trans isomerase A (cyclophilin A)